MTDPTCAITGCGGNAVSRGWCGKHYQRWRKHGDPNVSYLVVPSAATCLYCGGVNPAKGRSGPQASYCTKQCRRRADYVARQDRTRALQRERAAEARAKVVKVCPACGGHFSPARMVTQKYCTDRCRRKAARERVSTECAIDGCHSKVQAKGLCSNHYRAQHPNGDRWRKGNPETRRANLRRKTQQRRARTMGDPDAELIDRNDIGDRDGWRCGLCSRKVNRDLPYPHPQSASLDHIEPLSLGGKHVRANVQIAHLACNVAKGNRGGDEQLLLIG